MLLYSILKKGFYVDFLKVYRRHHGLRLRAYKCLKGSVISFLPPYLSNSTKSSKNKHKPGLWSRTFFFSLLLMYLTHGTFLRKYFYVNIDFTLYSCSLRWNSFKYTKALWSTKELTSEVATRTMLKARNRHCYSVTTSHTQEAGEGTLNAARRKPHISILLAFSNSQES